MSAKPSEEQAGRRDYSQIFQTLPAPKLAGFFVGKNEIGRGKQRTKKDLRVKKPRS
jgi:hypothetical protein